MVVSPLGLAPLEVSLLRKRTSKSIALQYSLMELIREIRDRWRAKERWMPRGNFPHTVLNALISADCAFRGWMRSRRRLHIRVESATVDTRGSECLSFPSVENEMIYNVQEVCVDQKFTAKP